MVDLAIIGGVLVLTIIALVVHMELMRREHNRQMRDLLMLMRSASSSEYAAASERVNTSARSRERQMKLENELAMNAAEFTRQQEEGLPVY